MFNAFKKILNLEDLTQEDLDKISPFLMLRWLEGNPGCLQIAQFLNVYHKIPLEAQIEFIKSITQGRIKYIKFIKGNKVESKELDLISKYFKISLDKALLYSEFLSKEDIKSIESQLDSLEPGQRIKRGK